MPEIATDEELLRYATAYIATSNALGDAIIALKRLEALTFDVDKVLVLMNDRRALEDRYARNERNFIAFHSQQIAMHPPSQQEVDAIVMLAAELAKLTLQRTDAAAVIALATEVADRFDEIQS